VEFDDDIKEWDFKDWIGSTEITNSTPQPRTASIAMIPVMLRVKEETALYLF